MPTLFAFRLPHLMLYFQVACQKIILFKNKFQLYDYQCNILLFLNVKSKCNKLYSQQNPK